MTGLVFENNKNIKVVKKGNVYSVEGFNKILNGIVELKAFACDGFEPEIQNLRELVKFLYQKKDKFIRIEYAGIYPIYPEKFLKNYATDESLRKERLHLIWENPFKESLIFFWTLKENFYGDFKLIEVKETENGNEYGKTVYQVTNSEEGIKKIKNCSETIIKDETTGNFFISNKKISAENMLFLIEKTKIPEGYKLEIGEKDDLIFVKETSSDQTATSDFYTQTGLADIEYMAENKIKTDFWETPVEYDDGTNEFFLWNGVEAVKGKIFQFKAKTFEKPADADKVTTLRELVTLLYSKETSKIFDKVKFTFIENEISNQIFNILSKNFYGTYKKVSKNGNFIWRFENSSSGLENFECRSFRIFKDGSECGYAVEGERFFLADRSDKEEVDKIVKDMFNFSEIFKNIKKEKKYSIYFSIQEEPCEKFYRMKNDQLEMIENDHKLYLAFENEKDDLYSVRLF